MGGTKAKIKHIAYIKVEDHDGMTAFLATVIIILLCYLGPPSWIEKSKMCAFPKMYIVP